MERNLLNSKQVYYRQQMVEYYEGNLKLFPKERLAFSYLSNASLILDLGCGAGRTAYHLEKMGHKLVALDIAENMLKSAQKTLCNSWLITADAAELPFLPQSFDAVVFAFNGLDCLYPLEKRLQALEEIKRVLKPEGVFIFSTHNHCFPRTVKGIRPFIGSMFKTNRSMYLNVSYEEIHFPLYLTTPGRQKQELEKYGVEIVDYIPRKLFRHIKRFPKLLGLLDNWLYYICRLR